MYGRDGGIEHSAQGCKAASQHKNIGEISVHVYPQTPHRILVLKGSHHDLSHHGFFEKEPEGSGEEYGNENDDNTVKGQCHKTEGDVLPYGVCQWYGGCAPYPLYKVNSDQHHGIGSDDGIIDGYPVEPPYNKPLDDIAYGDNSDDRDQGAQKEVFSCEGQKSDQEISADGIDKPMGEIDDSHGSEGKGESDTDDVQDRPDGQAVSDGAYHGFPFMLFLLSVSVCH